MNTPDTFKGKYHDGELLINSHHIIFKPKDITELKIPNPQIPELIIPLKAVNSIYEAIQWLLVNDKTSLSLQVQLTDLLDEYHQKLSPFQFNAEYRRLNWSTTCKKYTIATDYLPQVLIHAKTEDLDYDTALAQTHGAWVIDMNSLSANTTFAEFENQLPKKEYHLKLNKANELLRTHQSIKQKR